MNMKKKSNCVGNHEPKREYEKSKYVGNPEQQNIYNKRNMRKIPCQKKTMKKICKI